MRIFKIMLRGIGHFVRIAAAVSALFLAIVFLGNAVFSKSRIEGFRTGDPLGPACDRGKGGWTILSEQAIRNHKDKDDDNVLTDEDAAVEVSDTWKVKLSCTLQTHVIPAANGQAEVRYHLAFLEFNEAGVPYPLDKPIGSDLTQLDVLLHHLERIRSNYVVAFVHGWRHDASLGDANVGDLHIYAAQAARFIAERCRQNKAWCGTEVTAVYVGWPGARVDEARLQRVFGSYVGKHLGEIAAIPTLFDRKPVSEAVAPAVYSALATVSGLLNKRWTPLPQKMIVFGHSLGGNLLISALKDPMIKAIRNHRPGAIMYAPLGDLVVLINAASEASNWTALQREVWDRIPFTDDEGILDEIAAGHRFFNAAQRPILVAVTAARDWPPGGFRAADCRYLNRASAAATNPLKAEMQKALRQTNQDKSRTLFESGVDYDWATYDLFPAFRGDLRPLAGSLKRFAAAKSGDQNPDDECAPKPTPASRFDVALGNAIWRLADWLGYLPFMNTDIENTRTIGHMDPPRPAIGSISDSRLPRRMLGTTHELLGIGDRGTELPLSYDKSNAVPSCPIASNWLWNARRAKLVQPHGVFWDSGDLNDHGPQSPPLYPSPALRFIHGFGTASMAPITRANDPFWNVRAFDNALAKHDGYRLPSFICGMNQLVLDDITPTP